MIFLSNKAVVGVEALAKGLMSPAWEMPAWHSLDFHPWESRRY
jgi:hypothetical protein